MANTGLYANPAPAIVECRSPECSKRFDAKTNRDGTRKTRGPLRQYCSHACGNRKEHLVNGRTRALMRNYGITEEQYDAMFRAQGGVCKVCRKLGEHGAMTRRRSERLHVDHDHSTGRIRGLLCGKCNVALGLASDSVEVLEQMISYLKGELA